jgi:hypothetical protein
MTEYIIVGDTARYKECLVYIGGRTMEQAQKMLEQAKQDEHFKNHTNFQIKTTESKENWWNDPFLVN